MQLELNDYRTNSTEKTILKQNINFLINFQILFIMNSYQVKQEKRS